MKKIYYFEDYANDAFIFFSTRELARQVEMDLKSLAPNSISYVKEVEVVHSYYEYVLAKKNRLIDNALAQLSDKERRILEHGRVAGQD